MRIQNTMAVQKTNGHSQAHKANDRHIHHDHFATRSIHVGSEPDPSTGAVVPSLSVATTFEQDGVGEDRVCPFTPHPVQL